MSSRSLGNVISRLAGLKNASGRKVAPGAEYLDELEAPDPEVAGTAPPMPNFQNFMPNQQEVGIEEEPSPQSFDVRANQVNSPEQQNQQQQEEEDTNIFSRIGRGLGQLINSPEMVDQYNEHVPSRERRMARRQPTVEGNPETLAPPIETQQTEVAEGLPPVNPEMEQFEALHDQIPNEKRAVAVNENQEPGTFVEPGASQEVYANADQNLRDEIERNFGVELTPEMNQRIAEMETAVDAYIQSLNGVDVSLSERDQYLRDKIANRDLSPNEQITMALALLAPSIAAGLIGGKEAFFGALSGGAKGVSGILGNRQKEIDEAREALPGIALERANIAKEKVATGEKSAELKQKIQQSVPNFQLRKIAEQHGHLINGKLVLDTGNPLLPLKASALRTEKDYDTFREKTMPALNKAISSTEQGVQLMDNLDRLLTVSEEMKSGTGLGGVFGIWDLIDQTWKTYVPVGRDTVKDENGNEVRIKDLFKTEREQASDMYSQAIAASGSRAAFATYRKHFLEMIEDPYENRTLPYETVKGQVNSVKKKFDSNIVSKLDAEGVETSPIKELLSQSSINKKGSERNRKIIRAEAASNQVIGQ